VRPEAIQLLSSAGLFGPAIMVPVILSEQFGADKSAIGLIAGAFAAAGFVSSYTFGRASDVRGRRGILIGGLLLSGLATALQIISLFFDDLEIFAVVRIMIGFSSGVFPAALLAYAYDNTSGKMGKFSAWGAAGWGAGNLGLGLLFWVYQGPYYEVSYLLSASAIFLSFLIALRLPFTREVKMEVPLFPKELIKRNASVYSAMLIRHTGANMIWVTYPLFLKSIDADMGWIGVIYAVNAFGQFFVMSFLDRYDPALLVAVGLASSAATFYAFLMVGSFWEIIPAQLLLAAAWGCLYVGSLRYVMDRNKEKATASGVLSSTMSISGIIGPVMGGVAATVFDFKGTIFIAMGMSVLALAIFVFELRRSGEFYRLRVRSRGTL
jgi:DHA1 family quinolone resistance protein-like MFS transporter